MNILYQHGKKRKEKEAAAWVKNLQQPSNSMEGKARSPATCILPLHPHLEWFEWVAQQILRVPFLRLIIRLIIKQILLEKRRERTIQLLFTIHVAAACRPWVFECQVLSTNYFIWKPNKMPQRQKPKESWKMQTTLPHGLWCMNGN